MRKLASSTSCFVCGVQNPFGLHLSFYSGEPGEVISEITVPDHFQGYPGVVHGGIIAAMLDEVTGRVFMVEDSQRFMVTARLEVRYRKPVPTEQRLRLTGKLVRDDGRVGEAKGKVFLQDGTLLAEAEAVYVNIPAPLTEGFEQGDMGWRVYPDDEETNG